MLELENPDVWSDPARAQQLGKDKSVLESVVDGLATAMLALDDATELLELAVAEDDAETVAEVVSDLDTVEPSVAALEFRRMFSGEMDANNAFLDIQSGRRWHRGPGLGRHAVTHVPALGRGQGVQDRVN